MSPQKHHRKGFTLIELLVVIALMAILVLLLSPVLKSASLKSGAVASAANLRQIGILTLRYASENENKLPHGRWSGDVTNLWLNCLYPLAYDGKAFPGFVPSGTGDNLKGTIFRSPNLKSSEASPLRSYGWSERLLAEYVNPTADNTDSRVRLTQIPHPSQTAMCADTKNSSGLQANSISFRNSGSANILFIDGHVESRRQEQVPLKWGDPGYASFWLYDF